MTAVPASSQYPQNFGGLCLRLATCARVYCEAPEAAHPFSRLPWRKRMTLCILGRYEQLVLATAADFSEAIGDYVRLVRDSGAKLHEVICPKRRPCALVCHTLESGDIEPNPSGRRCQFACKSESPGIRFWCVSPILAPAACDLRLLTEKPGEMYD
jgi:hypothetical protein